MQPSGKPFCGAFGGITSFLIDARTYNGKFLCSYSSQSFFHFYCCPSGKVVLPVSYHAAQLSYNLWIRLPLDLMCVQVFSAVDIYGIFVSSIVQYQTIQATTFPAYHTPLRSGPLLSKVRCHGPRSVLLWRNVPGNHGCARGIATGGWKTGNQISIAGSGFFSEPAAPLPRSLARM